MTRPTGEDAMSSEHVEVLRNLSEVCRAAIKAGDWKVDGACDPDSLLRHADAAIASLSAPQPPAEAKPVALDYVPVKRSDLLRWAEDFVRDNDPGDDTDVVTPFDDYLLQPFADEFSHDLRALAQQPAAGGEEIMVNAAHDVYTLPLQPSGLSSGPRFVVHVPGPEQQPEAPVLAKHQPCGCVICTCEDEQQCQGCGAKHCGNRADHPPYVGQQPAAVDGAATNSAVAAIQFALKDPEGMTFLRLWNEGDFDTLRREWPDAPVDVYIDADQLADQQGGAE